MAKRRRGQYIVGEGADFRVKNNHDGYGYVHELVMNNWYVVHAHTGKILGQYASYELAAKLAIGLDKTDQEKLNKEIENILTTNE